MANYAPPAIDKVLDLLVDAVCIVDAKGQFLYVSAAFERIFGYTTDEIVGHDMIELVHPDDRERTLAAAEKIMDGQLQLHFENRYIRKDGRVIDIMWSARWADEDQVRIAVARDITARKRIERRQRAIYRLSEATHAAEDIMALYAHIHRIIAELLPAENFHVARYEPMSDSLSYPYFVDEHLNAPETAPLDAGSHIGEVILSGKALLTYASEPEHCHDTAGPDWLGVPLLTSTGVIGALVLRCPNIDDERSSSYTEDDLELLQFVSDQVTNAITRKQAESRLRHIAGHDALTDLPNRILFHDRLNTAISRARREGERLALLYLDLNGFKAVNDSHGHDIGDQLLQEVALRLKDCLRDSDTIARIGGDEFTVLLSKISSAAAIDRVRDKIHQAIEQPIEIGNNALSVSASIGAAIYPDHGENAEQLLRHADREMYSAKESRG